MRLLASIVFILISPACYAGGGCILGILDIAHDDCSFAVSAFPRDDASCRSYGLTPGTHDYAVCRQAKADMNRRTLDETSYSFLRNPLLPDLR
jgi:hypothetical protein